MNRDILFDAIGMISDETIEDAKAFSRRNAKFGWRRIAGLAAAVLVCFAAAVPALAAAEVEPAGQLLNAIAPQLLYAVSPRLAQSLKPVRKVCVDGGIQLEVVSAAIQDDTAEIYVSLKDLEGDRVDETTDLFDSYEIQDSYDSAAGCHYVGYDEETGAASFLISIRHMDGEKFQQDKVTFTMSRFLSHKTTFEGVLADVDLSTANLTPETQMGVPECGASGALVETLAGKMRFLQGEGKSLSAPTEGVTVTAMGYIGGKLHIQVHYEDTLRTDNHGWLSLQSSEGELLQAEGTASFWDEEQSGHYYDYVFDVPCTELGDYGLYGEFTTCDRLTEGHWSVTFPLCDVQ